MSHSMSTLVSSRDAVVITPVPCSTAVCNKYVVVTLQRTCSSGVTHGKHCWNYCCGCSHARVAIWCAGYLQ